MRDTLKKIKDDAKKVALGESKSKIYPVTASQQQHIEDNTRLGNYISPELITMMYVMKH